MRSFPYDHELAKEVQCYPPRNPEMIHGDILEIGPGRGDLLMELASQNPQKKIIAIELGKKRFLHLIPHLEKKELTNVYLIHGDARVILPRYFKENSFETAFVLFPDPWPKRKHEFRRLLNQEFLWLLTHQLKQNGILCLATDDHAYAIWIHDNLATIATLKNSLAPLLFVSSLPELPITFFEKKWRDMGRKIFFLKYSKV